MIVRLHEALTMQNELLRWRREASQEEWAKLAKAASTTVGYLDQIAYGNRRASPTKASQIEEATKMFPERKGVTKEHLVFSPLRSNAA